MTTNISQRFWLVATILCGIQTVVLWRGADRLSPNPDEFPHLIAGVSYWRTGSAGLYNVNPPLVRLIASLPAVMRGVRVPVLEEEIGRLDRSEFKLGRRYAEENPDSAFGELVIARRLQLLLIVPGTLAVMLLAYLLVHPIAAIAAGLVWAFNPLTLGSSLQLGCDIPGATMGVWAMLASVLTIEKPSWKSVFIAGMTLGLAVATKSTWLVAMPLWPIGFLVLWYSLRRNKINQRFSTFAALPSRRLLAISIAIPFVAWAVLVFAYRGQGLFVRLADYDFVSNMLAAKSQEHNRFFQHWTGNIPVVLPQAFLEGLDRQWADFDLPLLNFFAGHWQHGGWWWYYLAGLAIKLPLGWIILIMVSYRWVLKDPFLLLLGLCLPMLFLVLISSKTNMNEHIRYLWIILPMLALVASIAVAKTQNRILRVFSWAMVAWIVGAGAITYPFGISYANEFAGGPTGISRLLTGSGVDWSQGWIEAKHWLRKNTEDEDTVMVIEPDWYPLSVVGIYLNESKELLEQKLENNRGRPVLVLVSIHSRMKLEHFNSMAFSSATKVECIGYSIDVYRFPYQERFRTNGDKFLQSTR